MSQKKSKQVEIEISDRIEQQLSAFSETYGISKKDVIEKSLICFISAFR